MTEWELQKACINHPDNIIITLIFMLLFHSLLFKNTTVNQTLAWV